MTTKVVDFLNESGGSKFTESAPRPPPCGEENELTSNGGNSTKSSGSHKSHVSSKSHSSSRSGDFSHSPATTPRKSNLQPAHDAVGTGKLISSTSGTVTSGGGDASSGNVGGQHVSVCEDGDEESAPLGFEPEGSAANSPPYSENGTPPHLKWAENLCYLLDDSEGVEIFKDFMKNECDGGSEELDFWFACQGLKRKLGSGALPDGNIIDIHKVIYKHYVRSDKIKAISKDVKREIAQKLHSKTPLTSSSGVAVDPGVFDAAQEEVENSMRNVTYPAFLRSDYYVQYVQNYGESPKSSNQSSGSSSARPISGLLPVLHEDKELESQDLNSSSHSASVVTTSSGNATLSGINSMVPPTKPPLPSTSASKRTELSSLPSRRTETVTGSSLYGSKGQSLSYPAHVSYAPVSAQDSELQSISSDALTDDTMSITDSSVDGYPQHLRKKHHRKAMMMKHLAQHNREMRIGLHTQIIPRTEHAPKDRNVAETDPKRFAGQLIEKLTKVLEERESSAKMEEKLRSISEVDKLEGPSEKEKLVASFAKPVLTNISNTTASASSNNTSINTSHNNTSASFIPLIRPGSGLDEETAESILDQHCSRIWDASSHHTPSYSPPGGHHSPTPQVHSGKTSSKKTSTTANNTSNSTSLASSAFTGGVLSGGTSLPPQFGPSPRGYHSHHHHKKRSATAEFSPSTAPSSSTSSQPFDSGVIDDRGLIVLGTETHRHIHHHHHHHHSGGSSSKKSSTSQQMIEIEAHGHSWRTLSGSGSQGPANLSSDFAGVSDFVSRGRSSTRRSVLGGASGSNHPRNKSLDSSSNIDSGISMFDKDSVRVPNWSSNPANEKVMKWILDSETVQEAPGYTQDADKSSSSHKRSHRLNLSSNAVLTSSKSSKSKTSGRSTSMERSGEGITTTTLGIFGNPNLSGGVTTAGNSSTVDRLLGPSLNPGAPGGIQHLPSQPFAQDPSMPLLTPPNPTTQLEEAKRRLETQQHQQHIHQGMTASATAVSSSSTPSPAAQTRAGRLSVGQSCSNSAVASVPVKSKSFTGTLSKDKLRASASGTSMPPPLPPHSRTLPTTRTVPSELDTSGVSQTLDSRRRGLPSSSSSAPNSVQASPGDTIIGIYMGQEPIPYRHQLPGRAITLAQIKVLVTKRGLYKYYFKRHSDEFGDGAGAVFEEISDDSAVVPMFQGKIVVKVESVDK